MDDYKIENNSAIVYLRGELDHHTVKKMMDVIDKVSELYIPKKLTLDFSNLSFMDSSGIALIIGSYKRAVSINSSFSVTNVSKQAYKVFSAAGICKLLSINEKEKVNL